MPRRNPKPIKQISEERINLFWTMVQVDDPEECWPWLGRLNDQGYGKFDIDIPCRGKKRNDCFTHRISYVIFVERDTEKLVCHSCDNPICCNPYHLFEGTDLDNNRDRHRKGRTKISEESVKTRFGSGSENKNTKLNEFIVRNMRIRFTSGESIPSISKSVGVGYNTAQLAILGKTWKHVVD